jgi:CRISPR/Cas system CSM-associated protein Csm3 (group 7 of RAMP superfamily)
MDEQIHVTITVESPINLSSGQADVTVDAEVLHDVYGMPFFPAKRFKGLLYESALEVVEMAELCQGNFISRQCIDELFQHVPGSAVQLNIHDFHLDGYGRMAREWYYLQTEYADVLRPSDVLSAYTSLRYQTSIEKDSGVALDHSLHNMRVVDAGVVFKGTMELSGAGPEHLGALALAMKNLRYAGLKRNRGFGKIKCDMTLSGQDMDSVVKSVLNGEVHCHG